MSNTAQVDYHPRLPAEVQRNRNKCLRTTAERHATIECMRLLADLLTFPLLAIGAMLVVIDILLLLALIVGGPPELEATTGWWDLFVGLGIPGIMMLVGGILLTRKLAQQ